MNFVVLVSILVLLSIVLLAVLRKKQTRKPRKVEPLDFRESNGCRAVDIVSQGWTRLGTLSDSLKNMEWPATMANVTLLRLEYETASDITGGGIVVTYSAIYMAGPNPVFIPGLVIGDATSTIQSPRVYDIEEYFPYFVEVNPETNCDFNGHLNGPGYRYEAYAVSSWLPGRNVYVTAPPSQFTVDTMSLTWDVIPGAEEYAVEVSIRGFLNQVGDGGPREVAIRYGGITTSNSIDVQVAGTSFWNAGELTTLVKVRGYKLCSKSSLVSSCIAGSSEEP